MPTWTTSQCSFAIEYIPQVLEDIRKEVVSAFHGLSHGGLEIGGILLGTHSTERITITGYMTMVCEHAFGPSFQLSDEDHIRLAATIKLAHASKHTIVGWFHSHTRTGVFLSEADLEIYNRHFIEPWQVALVLKPFTLKPTLCGFFFREANGSIHSQESYQTFEPETWTDIERPEKMPLRPQLGQPAVSVPSEPPPPSKQSEEELPRSSQEPAEALPPDALKPEALRPAALQPGVPEAAALQPAVPEAAGAEAAAPERAAPKTMHAPPNRDLVSPPLSAAVSPPWESPGVRPARKPEGLKIHWPRALVGVSIVFALGATYMLLNRSERGSEATGAQPAAPQAVEVTTTGSHPASGQALGLKMQRQGPDLALTWNRNLPETLGVSAGLLNINDGRKRKEMSLTAEQLRSANILIVPESEHVEVQLVVLLPDRRILSESGMLILPAQSLPPQQTSDSVEPAPTVPGSTATGARIQTDSPRFTPNRVLDAPPHPSRSAVTPLMNKQPAEKAATLVERPQANSPKSARSHRSLPSPAPVAESTRAEGPRPGTVSTPAPSVPTQTPPSSTSTASSAGASGNSQAPKLIYRKNPSYPSVARNDHLQGVVALEALLGTDGRVKSLTVISGHRLFRQAAVDAVSQWVYKPAMLNGKATEARTRVEILFRQDM